MIVKVRMIAFGDGQIREVEIPDGEWNAQFNIPTRQLELVFHYGQNDFQPVSNCPSVSVGDVIELEDKLFKVCGFGFSEMSQEQYEAFAQLDQRDRVLIAYGFHGEVK